MRAEISTVSIPSSADATAVPDIVYLHKGQQFYVLSPQSDSIQIGNFTFEAITNIPQGDEAIEDAVTPIFSTESNPGAASWFGTQHLIENFLSEKSVVSLSTAGSGATYSKITINPEDQKQAITGFGATLDETVVRNLLRMKPEYRQQVLELLIDPEKGIGLDTFKLTIGASDICSKALYTYDDVGEGELDLANFSIEKDVEYGIFDIIREVLNSTIPMLTQVIHTRSTFLIIM